MLFENKNEQFIIQEKQNTKEYTYNKEFGFINELQNAVRTDEEFAKYKGYIN